NKPLTRADLEPIGTVAHNGTAASTNLTHTINVPTDRNGYHVILAVWDVADTSNAFYNVIDINLVNNG
ncbi:lytic polysaccharide monooxygenase, partial [Lysinibacillus sphaericus]